MQIYKTQRCRVRIETARSEAGLFLVVERWYEPERQRHWERILEVEPVGCGQEYADQRAAIHRAPVIV